MSDAELFETFCEGADECLQRAKEGNPGNAAEFNDRILGAWISGWVQAAEFLNQMDGAVNGNQVIRVMHRVADALQYSHSREAR